jgi:hypothetical protein
MSIAEKYGQLVERRKQIDGDVDYENEPVILESIALLTDNMQETIDFLDHHCTGEQFVWMSEIFDEIVNKSQSREFILSLRRTTERYPLETRRYEIRYCIDYAEGFLK